jgi:hypothetical protein
MSRFADCASTSIIDNEFTVKYLDFDKKRNAFFLRAGNIAYAPIRLKCLDSSTANPSRIRSSTNGFSSGKR